MRVVSSTWTMTPHHRVFERLVSLLGLCFQMSAVKICASFRITLFYVQRYSRSFSIKSLDSQRVEADGWVINSILPPNFDYFTYLSLLRR
jgi:hypothetical protein